MLYAVISDIHSNLEALEAVLADARLQGAEGYLCLGDIVGYASEPEGCVKRVRSLGALAVAGNHDIATCGKLDLENFTPYAKAALQWTIPRVSEEGKFFLASLPLVIRKDDFCLVHASLDEPQKWKYIFNLEDALPSLKLLKEKLLFVGHAHRNNVFSYRDGEAQELGAQDLAFSSDCEYLISVGSVGQSRDRDPRASYCLYDSAKKELRFRRVEYDFRITQEKILKVGLPPFLALRLELGR
ncbi:MAG: metallophosphoesterase [Chlamydiae bacterium]|nr:metallophosphoesterase [Chlamydiota bacterium]MBI3266726.1 metallophosphoesterase [Chlamydiota bacterium]